MNANNLPEIRIRFSYLLYGSESKWLAGNNKLESTEFYEAKTNEYRKSWKKHEQKILKALQDALGVRFYKSVHDVACAPFFIPKSDPLIMNFANEPDQFVDVLMHELCHVLLTDNNVVQIASEQPVIDLFSEWQQLFGKEHNFNTLVHIPVHALSKYIYHDVLKQPKRQVRDIESVKRYKGAAAYLSAWEYVDTGDYKKILEQLKESYAGAVK